MTTKNNKKKINSNTVANTGAKSIDSFFTISSTSSIQTSPTNEIQPQNNSISQNVVIETRENVLKTLTQNNIMYAHTEIKSKIDNLSEDEMTEIFKIIKNNNEKYSTNKNGIFINLSTLKKNTIQEISNFLFFCDNNNKAIIEEEIERAKYKEIIND